MHCRWKLLSQETKIDLVQLFEFGVGVHHAGMLRADRGLTERLFSDGILKVKLIQLSLQGWFL